MADMVSFPFPVSGVSSTVPTRVPPVPSFSRFFVLPGALNTGAVRFSRNRDDLLGPSGKGMLIRSGQQVPVQIEGDSTEGWILPEVAGDGLVFIPEHPRMGGVGSFSGPRSSG